MPEDYEFSTQIPPISGQDLDIIKMTALYVAKHGQQFLTTLSHKESKNYQFDFLNPSHSLHELFTELITQYEKVIKPTERMLNKVEQGIHKKYTVLDQAKIRAEWEAQKQQEREDEKAKEEEERVAYAEIDWHDFVVVETVTFTSADFESEDLPPPTTLSQIQFASLEQKKLSSYKIEEAPPDYEPASDTEREAVTEETEPSLPEEANTTQPPQKTSVKIRPAGTTRRDKLRQKKAGGEQKFVSPLTGELVPQSQYDEHMRISQIDPNWKNIKQVENERMSTSNLPAVDIEANLKRFASTRGEPEAEQEDDERRKRAKEEVQWDGYTASKDRARREAKSKVDPQEQKREKQRQKDRENAIGPQK